MSYVIVFINVKNSGVSCLALIFYLSNPRMTILHAKSKIWLVIHPFFNRTIRTSCSVDYAKCIDSEDMDSHQSLAGCWNSLLPLGHFAWHWARYCTDTHALYCFTIYNSLCLGFRQWQCCTDRVLTLKMNIWLSLFWGTWSRALGPGTRSGLAHGRNYSYWRAMEQKWEKRLCPWFSLNYRKYFKNHGPRQCGGWGLVSTHFCLWFRNY